MALHDQIVETTEVRRHNGQCAYGECLDLSDEEVPEHVREAVTDEVAEAICRDMRREPHPAGNTDDAGRVEVGGVVWLYRR